MLRKLLQDQSGEDLIEYSLLTATISIAAIATLRLIGLPIQNMFALVLGAVS